jgi:hypothetical protein
MLETLRQLRREGIDAIDAIENLLDYDTFNDDAHRRLCLAIAVHANWTGCVDLNYVDDSEVFDDWVTIDGYNYRICCDGNEAHQACTEHVRNGASEYDAGMLARATGFDRDVFRALANSVDNPNPAVCALIDVSCGMTRFVNRLVDSVGRGHFLSLHDGKETEFTFGNDRTAYLYRN